MTALANDGMLRLGRQAGKWEGWWSVGTGLAQAVGNVDRLRIKQRDDQRQYAMGVLGLGSMLLTQMKREHSEQIITT